MLWAKAPGAEVPGPVMQVAEHLVPGERGRHLRVRGRLHRGEEVEGPGGGGGEHRAPGGAAAGARLAAAGAGGCQGRAGGAQAALEEKRVPADTYWYLAEALRQCRRGKDARPHLEKYLAKAGKKGAFAAEAAKRLAAK